ncbi:protein-disulfide reductase DsbD domain-containing protein [Citreimonas salinaria]|uniref:Disulphide bond corrector protein DsbC n=1 Tax=Citreimonas salinaria TaxID=321339 RepID=A0A1H3HRP1_9RHOB|nr:protein-disulfide reductase DsbD domain-containing protein [Citreimonas salinaria]SDY17468.1 Disulphide bond corrector protein DsbC [Citreimonas salinaria]
MLRLISLALCLALTALPLRAESLDSVVSAELRPGWRLPDGSHMAALHLRLAPGWKTYWRSPGAAGIPPLFRWSGSGPEVAGVSVIWPTPYVFHQSGLRSVGYRNEVVLPLRVRLRDADADAQLAGTVELGICKDICMPHEVRVSATLPAAARAPDPRIAAALADQPLTHAEAGVRQVRCSVAPVRGGIALRATLDVPRPGGAVETVIETADPEVWVAEPESRWEDGALVAEAEMRHIDGGAFAVDRSAVRITVLRDGQAIDVMGCSG